MKWLSSVLFFLIFITVFPQGKLDTLLLNLKEALHETDSFNAFMDLGNYFQYINPDTAIYFHKQAEKISERIYGVEGDLRKGEAIRAMGWDYYILSDYFQALTFYENAMKIAGKYIQNTEFEEIAKKLWARSAGNIGIVYKDQGNYAKALEYYFKALKVDEELKNKNGILRHFGNIGGVFHAQRNFNKALEYYFKSLNIINEIGNKSYQAAILGNIGGVYHEQGNYDKALEFYFKALQVNNEIENKQGQATILGNIGGVFMGRGNFTAALDYYFKALQLNKELGNKLEQAINLANIGEAYYFLKQYLQAAEYLKKAEQLNRLLGILNNLKYTLLNLSKLYEQTGRYKDALYYYKEFTKAQDSLNSEENRKALQTMELKYQYEKEQALKEKEHQKQLAIQRKEKERQKVISYAIGSGLVLVLIFSVVIFNRLQITRKQKRIIEEQKQQVELQKQLVEQKNKEITDSITYAKRIQEAILPSESKWQALLPDSFVFYLPKDIVAGDFYWLEETDDYIFVAAADCTGHGVPGAMVSVVCSNALTKSVLEERIFDTDKILNRTKEIVTEKLSASEKHIQDGMDVALVRISKKNRQQIQFSGANRPLLIVGSEGIREIKGDKQPVGLDDRSGLFTAKELELKPGEEIFMYTDGYSDQFGGEKGKKMGNRRFKEILQEIYSLTCQEQRAKISEYFTVWKQSEEQLDDVTVVGIKV
ncbi:MAG: hypothetical protein KatS3mg028_1361 [Bacteroidia bacterium]|nr:MAG: hypothetical protein KatS3mg028_1361 [Bacteroidia bacterium]